MSIHLYLGGIDRNTHMIDHTRFPHSSITIYRSKHTHTIDHARFTTHPLPYIDRNTHTIDHTFTTHPLPYIDRSTHTIFHTRFTTPPLLYTFHHSSLVPTTTAHGKYLTDPAPKP